MSHTSHTHIYLHAGSIERWSLSSKCVKSFHVYLFQTFSFWIWEKIWEIYSKMFLLSQFLSRNPIVSNPSYFVAVVVVHFRNLPLKFCREILLLGYVRLTSGWLRVHFLNESNFFSKLIGTTISMLVWHLYMHSPVSKNYKDPYELK